MGVRQGWESGNGWVRELLSLHVSFLPCFCVGQTCFISLHFQWNAYENTPVRPRSRAPDPGISFSAMYMTNHPPKLRKGLEVESGPNGGKGRRQLQPPTPALWDLCSREVRVRNSRSPPQPHSPPCRRHLPPGWGCFRGADGIWGVTLAQGSG